ncbi:GNAT family N-acetyltransferase [Flavobacterium selenitireducens]|uniref:GNAT family N-acetyltransferase n=1 Tax=Flavobacterium selenitireducens TaxID=2722704 RepID=UPI00168BA91C|nr:GNAT family N-acetyltransferase [Flavobacterium selenitireducens]MBD3582522.1 GNAT family N-acetyltransferase [Flavobacterium selenitireducens]
MQNSIETPRLLLRPIEISDADGLFALDSNPDVHIYLGRNPVKSMDVIYEVIDSIQSQYKSNGIGRWAVVEKSSGKFLGWSGLKFEKDVNGRSNFYDFGYRLRQEFWGKGFATEAGRAWIEHGFDQMKLPLINAFVSAGNAASRRVLEKCGLQHTESFEYDGGPECWYEIRNPKFPEE